ncbi:MAG: efflux RND transporter periplasmic adaptor subunit [Krumholzibacteria bacterium]|nr:efflux RND transporter periplasmic adaptor subunit [Candidatus Krumholzibacteria bacterium]
MKKVILAILAVAVLGAVVVSILRSGGKAEATVETGQAALKDLTATVDCSGTIEPKRKVDVSANAMGTIVNLAVHEGQSLAPGDLLLEIDPSEYAAAVRGLEASIRTAQADLRLAEASRDQAVLDRDRAEQLFQQDLASEEAVTAARTGARVEQARVEAARHRIEQYEANLAKARHDLTKVTLTAPMAGVVTRLNVEEGENAIMGTLNNPGTVLLTISDLGTMEAWVEVDETEVVDVALGQPAEVTIDAFPGRTFTGRVTEIGNSPLRIRAGATREAVDFEVKITLDEAPANIRPGLSAKASIKVAERAQALAVPLGAVTVRAWPLQDADIRRYSGKRARQQEAALAELGFTPRGARAGADSAAAAIERKETEGVFVLKDGYAKFVPVELGIAGEDDFEVLSGLEAGRTVVTGPFRILRELKDGARVETARNDRRGRRGADDR